MATHNVPLTTEEVTLIVAALWAVSSSALAVKLMPLVQVDEGILGHMIVDFRANARREH